MMFDFNKVYALERAFLKSIGIYPLNETKYTCILITSAIMAFVLVYLHFVLMLIQLFCQVSNITKASNILLYLMTHIAFVSKMTNFALNKHQMCLVDDILNNPIFKTVSLRETEIIVNSMVSSKYLSVVFRFLCVGVVLFYGIYPVIDISSENMYPLDLWYPFDPNGYYSTIILFEVSLIALGAWTNSNIDILTIKLISLGTAQIEILKKKLKSLVNNMEEVVTDEIVNTRLKHCIEHYSLILR